MTTVSNLIEYLISFSLLIAAVILIRAIFRKKVSGKLIYALWLAVIIRLCIPINLISLNLPIPQLSEIDTLLFESSGKEPEESVPTPPVLESVPVVPSADTGVPVLPSEQVENAGSVPTAPAEKTDEAPANASPRYELSPEELIAIAWLCGSFLTLLGFAIPFGIKKRKLIKSRRYHSTEENIKVFVSDKILSPCVMGIVPTIYITPYAESCKDLSLIIQHEKTHIRHGDHLWALIRIALLVLFWWNPLVWAAALLSKRDAEVCCDESVVRTMDDRERLVYSRLIVDMIPQRGGFVVAFASSPIKYRIFRLTGRFRTTVIAAVATLITALLVLLLAFVSNGIDDGENTLIHIHRFNEEATCTTSAKCACGDVKGSPLGHEWTAATCSDPKTCSRCSLAEGIPLEHTWVEATCDSAKTCSVCKITLGEHLEHVIVSATCTSPSYCSLCNKPEGSPLGHSFTEPTCTSPAVCTRCNTANGAALGHSYYLGVCQRCNTVDSAFYADIKSRFYSPYEGYSKKSAKNTITGLGYSPEEAEYILTNLNINWYDQAYLVYTYYMSNTDFPCEPDLINILTDLGFTNNEIGYVIDTLREYSYSNIDTVYINDFTIKLRDDSEYLKECREWHEKYDKLYEDDDDDDSWKYGFDTPSVDKPIRWDYGGMTP
ncbi:MAG: hypothetical protein E7647_00085 [Ruminococcaceae bacterium]|nr:hypothetical protein [Oscillospiraceae bacterium]